MSAVDRRPDPASARAELPRPAPARAAARADARSTASTSSSSRGRRSAARTSCTSTSCSPCRRGAYGLVADPSPIRVHGGTRIVGIAVDERRADGDRPNVLDVDVDQQGDFSPYLLAIGWARDDATASGATPFDDVDRLVLGRAGQLPPGLPGRLRLRAGRRLPARRPARARARLPRQGLRELPPAADRPRRAAQPGVDRAQPGRPRHRAARAVRLRGRPPQLLPGRGRQRGVPRHGAPARVRQAAREARRLPDARRPQCLDVRAPRGRQRRHDPSGPAAGHADQRAAALRPPARRRRRCRSRSRRRARGSTRSPTTTTGPILRSRQVRVFETAATVAVDPLNNELRIHAWGNEQCCLPARRDDRASLRGRRGRRRRRSRPPLRRATTCCSRRCSGPTTGAAADADPAHRQVVRIERRRSRPVDQHVGPAPTDARPLFLADVDPRPASRSRSRRRCRSRRPLPLVEVTWRAADALDLPALPVRAARGRHEVHRISVARGNIALGRPRPRSSSRPYDFDPPLDGDAHVPAALAQGPLTMQCQPGDEPPIFPPVRERPRPRLRRARGAARRSRCRPAAPARSPARGGRCPTCCRAPSSTHHFVADVDDDGPRRAALRRRRVRPAARRRRPGRRLVPGRQRPRRQHRRGCARAHRRARSRCRRTGRRSTRVRNPLPARGGRRPRD